MCLVEDRTGKPEQRAGHREGDEVSRKLKIGRPPVRKAQANRESSTRAPTPGGCAQKPTPSVPLTDWNHKVHQVLGRIWLNFHVEFSYRMDEARQIQARETSSQKASVKPLAL